MIISITYSKSYKTTINICPEIRLHLTIYSSFSSSSCGIFLKSTTAIGQTHQPNRTRVIRHNTSLAIAVLRSAVSMFANLNRDQVNGFKQLISENISKLEKPHPDKKSLLLIIWSMGSDLSNDSYYKVVQLLSDAGAPIATEEHHFIY